MTPTEAAYLLGVPEGADADRIENARKREARLWHPDRQSDPDVAQFASDRMASINQAADLLRRSTAKSDEHAQTTSEPGPPPRRETSPPQSPDVSALLRAARSGVVALALTVTVLAPFLDLRATYGLALVLGVGIGLGSIIRNEVTGAGRGRGRA